MSAWTPLPTAHIGGLDIVTASRDELTRTLLADHRRVRTGPSSGARLVFDANGQALSLAARDPAYRAALEASDMIHADGGFLVTLSRWIGSARIAERSATTDLIHDLSRVCGKPNLSYYLLGGSEDVNARAAGRLAKLYPNLTIAGRHHGYFTDIELDRIVEDINAADPDVVWLGLGKPREQIVAVAIAPRLSATWIVTCGGCFDFLVGDARRAPGWMQRSNLEWFFRLAQNPRRLFWRYATTNPHALWVVLVTWLRGSAARTKRHPGA